MMPAFVGADERNRTSLNSSKAVVLPLNYVRIQYYFKTLFVFQLSFVFYTILRILSIIGNFLGQNSTFLFLSVYNPYSGSVNHRYFLILSQLDWIR